LYVLVTLMVNDMDSVIFSLQQTFSIGRSVRLVAISQRLTGQLWLTKTWSPCPKTRTSFLLTPFHSKMVFVIRFFWINPVFSTLSCWSVSLAISLLYRHGTTPSNTTQGTTNLKLGGVK
jgi:hypothetical protein